MRNLVAITIAIAIATALVTNPYAAISAEHTNDEIVVSGKPQHFKLSLHALRAAQAAFLAYRGQYAPASSLSFTIERPEGQEEKTAIRLYLTDGRQRSLIAFARDGSFQLPPVATGDWWMESNVPHKLMRIGAQVLSPQSSSDNYRLGDARLRCRAIWAMEKANASILEAPLVGLFATAGPCTNKKIGIMVTGPGRISAATLTEGKRSQRIPVVKNGRLYALPVQDQSFGDEAQVRLRVDR